MTHFYYSKGKPVSVRPLNSAYVAALQGNRAITNAPGWRQVPLGSKGLVVFIKEELMADRADSVTPDALVETLSNHGELGADQARQSSLHTALTQHGVGGVLPVLLTDENHVVFPTGEVTLQLKPGISPEQLTVIAREKHFRVLRPIPYITNGIVVKAPNGEDGVELARVLVESGVAVFAEPNFVEHLPHRLMLSPNNSEFPNQWHLNNTGQLGTPPGVDISAIKAWDITTGSPSICIAIIDNGVDLTHEAFTAPGKFIAPFDFEDSDSQPLPVESSHGTSCAGIAVAPLNRGKVVGVAPGCTLMPIRRATVSDHLKMADAFAWAADKGADVISCSFGYDNRPWPQPEIVSRAVEYAATRGRNGKGCVIVWAAGNGNEPISTDEWASNKNVITVAAVTDKNERAEYSDYGPEVDVCAPSNGGVNGITTTDIGGYTNSFGGTSAAAPMVAGVAGLILSMNPNLSSQEVRTLICTSADKVDTAPEHYDANTGHSQLYGYGRVNAHEALDAIDVLREAVQGDHKLENSLIRLSSFSDILVTSEDGKQINAFLKGYKFAILHLLIHQPEIRSRIQQCLRWVLTVSAAETADPIPFEILRVCRDIVVQIVSVNRAKESLSQERQAQSTNNLNEEGMAMSENRAVENILGQLKNLIAEASTSSTATQEPPPATSEQPPVQTHMANGANVEVGHLVSTVMEAVNRSSPELLKGRRGITIGMLIPPTVSPSDGIRLDDPYIPKTPIEKLSESPRVGLEELDAFASKTGAIVSEILTQRSAMTLPSTRRAESLAMLRRLNLISGSESDQLEKLLTLSDQNRSIPTDYSLLLRDGRSSPVFKAILSCALTAAEMDVSSSGVEGILQEGQNRYRVGGLGGDTPHRPEPGALLDAIPRFDVGNGIIGAGAGASFTSRFTKIPWAVGIGAAVGAVVGGFGGSTLFPKSGTSQEMN